MGFIKQTTSIIHFLAGRTGRPNLVLLISIQYAIVPILERLLLAITTLSQHVDKRCKTVTMHRVFPRNTWRSTRIVFRTDSKEGTLYKRSPFCVGSKLWDALSVDPIELPDVFVLKTRLKRLSKGYLGNVNELLL